jgi:hypothetical protein
VTRLALLLALVACGPAQRPPGLDLRANGPGAQAEADAQGRAYLAAGLPAPGGPVWVGYFPPLNPNVVGAGNHTTTEGSGPSFRVICWVDRWDALPHELLHAALLWARTDGDPGHWSWRWGSPLLWPPGSRRPPFVVAVIGEGT